MLIPRTYKHRKVGIPTPELVSEALGETCAYHLLVVQSLGRKRPERQRSAVRVIFASMMAPARFRPLEVDGIHGVDVAEPAAEVRLGFEVSANPIALVALDTAIWTAC